MVAVGIVVIVLHGKVIARALSTIVLLGVESWSVRMVLVSLVKVCQMLVMLVD